MVYQKQSSLQEPGAGSNHKNYEDASKLSVCLTQQPPKWGPQIATRIKLSFRKKKQKAEVTGARGQVQ